MLFLLFTTVLLLCACKLGLACLEDESSAPSKSLMLLFRDIAYTTKLLSDLLLLLLLCRRACLYTKVTRYYRLSLMIKEAYKSHGGLWLREICWMGDLLFCDIAYTTKLLSNLLLLLLLCRCACLVYAKVTRYDR